MFDRRIDDAKRAIELLPNSEKLFYQYTKILNQIKAIRSKQSEKIIFDEKMLKALHSFEKEVYRIVEVSTQHSIEESSQELEIYFNNYLERLKEIRFNLFIKYNILIYFENSMSDYMESTKKNG